ncbi:hypothetical protein A8F94_17040 [Bacillus sp. FJAT-27225]|nr:hypothetical protein A8F94_17040 [Bacillus sp. FJAT-27225]
MYWAQYKFLRLGKKQAESKGYDGQEIRNIELKKVVIHKLGPPFYTFDTKLLDSLLNHTRGLPVSEDKIV